MRRTRFIPALLVILLSSCNKQMFDDHSSEGKTGEVNISLSADERVEIVSVRSGSETPVPAAGDFWIEIFNSSETRVFREKYSDIPNGRMTLNPGSYKLLAKHGDTLGVGFDKPFYMDEVAFSVTEQERTDVDVVAVLSNVKAKVVYGDQIKADYAPLDEVAKVPLLKAANLEEGGSGGMSDGTLFGWPMLTAATNEPKMAEKFGKRFFATPKKMGAETAEANINAGLAAARQIVDYFVNGNTRFQVNK